MQLLDQLHPAVHGMFPFIVTRKGVVEKEVYHDLTRTVTRNGTFSGYCNQLRDARTDKLTLQEAMYTQLADCRAKKLKTARGTGSIMAGFGRAEHVNTPAPRAFLDVQVWLAIVCCLVTDIVVWEPCRPRHDERYNSCRTLHSWPGCPAARTSAKSLQLPGKWSCLSPATQ
jgi:hypothetical protein